MKREFYIGTFLFFLLGVLFVIFGENYENSPKIAKTIENIGYFIIPICTLTLLYELVTRKNIEEKIEEAIKSNIKSGYNEMLRDSRIVETISNIYTSRDEIGLKNLIENAENNIDIFVTNFNYLSGYSEIIKKKIDSGVNIRFLIMNPSSSFVKLRAKDVSRSISDFKQELNTYLKEVETIISGTTLKSNVTLKLYNDSPSLIYYRIDNKVIIGFILKQGRSREHIHIELLRKGHMSINCFEEHFEETWKNSYSNGN